MLLQIVVGQESSVVVFYRARDKGGPVDLIQVRGHRLSSSNTRSGYRKTLKFLWPNSRNFLLVPEVVVDQGAPVIVGFQPVVAVNLVQMPRRCCLGELLCVVGTDLGVAWAGGTGICSTTPPAVIETRVSSLYTVHIPERRRAVWLHKWRTGVDPDFETTS